MKIPFNPLRYRYHSLRSWLVQPAFWLFFFVGAALDIFRVDMINQRLIFAGHAYPFEFQYLMWLPIGFYAGVVAIGIISFVCGRLFCGWACPHNTLTEWTRPFRAVFGLESTPHWLVLYYKRWLAFKTAFTVLSLPIAFLMTFGLSILLTAYIVPLDWVLAQYTSGKPHIAMVFGQGLFTLIGLFLLYSGHEFCRTCCPYGMAQSMSAYQEGKWKPMEILFTGEAFDSEGYSDSCKTCTGCQTICPVEIDPRKPENLKVGQFYGCFNCGECVDACKTVHQKHGYQGLLRFEHAWERKRPEVSVV